MTRHSSVPLLHAVHAGRHDGYRTMWRRLQQQYHLRTTREMIRHLLLQVDPTGVAGRRQHRLRRRT